MRTEFPALSDFPFRKLYRPAPFRDNRLLLNPFPCVGVLSADPLVLRETQAVSRDRDQKGG
jgi:hypothetical protein